MPVSIYCVWQWWEQHYQAAHGRPDQIDFDWLDETYLGRQRQLHAWFDDLGIGQADPTLDTGFVSMLLPCDFRFIEAAAASQGVAPCCDLHHCSVPTESFAKVYAAIPGLHSLQGGIHSDIRAIRICLPAVNFSGMINPVELITRPHADLLVDIENALNAGVHDLALWDVDPAVTPAQLGKFLRALARIARQHGREPGFSFIPITWEELDWEFSRYQGEGGLS